MNDSGESETPTPPATRRLYWEDDHCLEADAVVVAAGDPGLAMDRTCFYPGGGGQPCDDGSIRLENGDVFAVVSVHTDAHGVIWHAGKVPPPRVLPGASVRLIVNGERRLALTRYHTVLHVLNTIALRDYNAWITGVQIAADYSRIDFKLEGFSPAIRAELEGKVNAVLKENRSLKSYSMPEEEFRRRSDLLRTLEAQPPVIEGRVRVVEIEGFDAQACGGTHVSSTAELGRFTIFRTENKGRINKRLYVRLDTTS